MSRNKNFMGSLLHCRGVGRVALSRRFALDFVCDENVQQAVSFEATLIKGCRASGRHDERV